MPSMTAVLADEVVLQIYCPRSTAATDGGGYLVPDWSCSRAAKGCKFFRFLLISRLGVVSKVLPRVLELLSRFIQSRLEYSRGTLDHIPRIDHYDHHHHLILQHILSYPPL